MSNNYQDYLGQAQKSQNDGTLLIVLCVLLVVAVLCAFGTLAKNEAIKQRRNDTAWFWLGFFFMINAFIALKVSKAADEEGHSLLLWSTFGIFFGIASILAFESGLNAENKQHDFDCWCLLGFCFGLVALFVSCFLKPFEQVKSVAVKPATTNPASIPSTAPKTTTTTNSWTCAKCSHVNTGSGLYCSKCGSIKYVR